MGGGTRDMVQAVFLLIISSVLGTFIRLIRGPNILDRVVAANAIGIMFFSLILLYTYYYRSGVFLDVALVYAILLFVDTLIMAKYLDRRGGRTGC